MNYLDVGLPHTEYFPRRTTFSPPRSIPMSGLSRRYMGLEPVTKHEIDASINRLCQPKRAPTAEAAGKDAGRFVGQKRMSTSQISRMVDRLYCRRPPKVADDGTDMETDAKSASVKSAKDRENAMLLSENTGQWRKAPSANVAADDARIADKDSVKVNVDISRIETNTLKPKQDIIVKSAFSFGNEPGPSGHDVSKERTTQLVTRQNTLKDKDLQSATLDTTDSHTPSAVLNSSVHMNSSPEANREAKGELFVPKESLKLGLYKSPRAAFDKSDTIKLEVEDTLWVEHVDVSVGLRGRGEGAHRSVKSASRPQRKRKRKLTKLEDTRPGTSKAELRARLPTPCDDQLIHRVASINRSPRADQSWT